MLVILDQIVESHQVRAYDIVLDVGFIDLLFDLSKVLSTAAPCGAGPSETDGL
jgi:hypothetical protein